jgi:hypothetical protein
MILIALQTLAICQLVCEPCAEEGEAMQHRFLKAAASQKHERDTLQRNLVFRRSGYGQ